MHMNEDLSQVVSSLRRMMQDRHSQQDESILELTEIDNNAREAVVVSGPIATITGSVPQVVRNDAHPSHLYAKMGEISETPSSYDASGAGGLDKKQDFFENLVKDTLMEWMNKHLPGMVRELVMQEIKTLSNELYAKKNS